MDSTADAAIAWASTATKDQRCGFLKRLLNVYENTELNDVLTILHHHRRKKLKRTQPSHTSCVVPQPSSDVSLPTKGWWSDWLKEGAKGIKCMDCEFVSVPRFPQQCIMRKWTNKAGLECVSFDSRIRTQSVEYIKMAATLYICDFNGDKVYEASIKYDPGTYLVNKWTHDINGFTWDCLRDGEDFTDVQRKVQEELENTLCIGCNVVSDLDSLQLPAKDFERFDIQYEYQGPVYNQGVMDIAPHSLRSIYKAFFDMDIQHGVHSPEKDAKATMQIFRDIYIPAKAKSNNPMSKSRMKLYDDDCIPRLKK